MYLLGMGFSFDDAAAAKRKAKPVSEMHRLIENDPRNAERVFPYIGGEEINTSPMHAHRRWCIDFNDFPLRRDPSLKSWFFNEGTEACDKRRREWLFEGVVPADYPRPVAADWPDLLQIVEQLVKPARNRSSRAAYRDRWWLFGEKRPGLRRRLPTVDAVQVLSRVSTHHGITSMASSTIFAETTVVIADERPARCGVLQGRPHELWAAFFASTLGDGLRYGPADCFETFPFPPLDDPTLGTVAKTYHEHRAALMVARDEGMTKTYNRFHDQAERGEDIRRLRELHHELDLAVLRAYGWDDLADRAAPEHLTADTEPDHRYQGRLFWPAPFRDEVLARLLDLNRHRAAEERALGLAPHAADPDDEDADEGEDAEESLTLT